jgi:Xaa-Pro dipeptidase
VLKPSEPPSRVPEGEVVCRLGSFRERLRSRGLAGALLTARLDRFYLSGTGQDGVLWVDALGDPVFWVIRDAERALAETAVEVRPVRSRRELWTEVQARTHGDRFGIVGEAMTVAELGRLAWAPEPEDVSAELQELRSRKSAWEVERMEESGRVASAVYAYAADVLRPGLTEAELAGLLFARAMALGHEGLLRSRGFEAYSWHVLSGPNTALYGANDAPMSGEGLSPAFPVGAGRREIRSGEPVLVDFGICTFGYQTDQTRTFCIGPPPLWLTEAHRALEEVYAAHRRELLPGAAAGEVFAAGLRKAHALGLPGYLGPPDRPCRFIGHGVGLETSEYPVIAEGSTTRLETGMTIALEPKAVLDARGGLGVEDTFVVTAAGPRPLADLPLELIRV